MITPHDQVAWATLKRSESANFQRLVSAFGRPRYLNYYWEQVWTPKDQYEEIKLEEERR